MITALSKKQRPNKRDNNPKMALFYLFLIAQICAIFGLVVGIGFFIVRVFRIIG